MSGSSDYKIIPDPEYGYLRLEPMPSREEVARFYEEEFYATFKPQIQDSSLEVQTAQKEFFDWRWSDILRVVRRYYRDQEPSELSLFDLGCGFSQALIYFRDQGFEVAGMEVAAEAVAYGREHGIEVIQGEADSIPDLGGRRYDVVLMLDVLEHLRRPARILTAIREHLLSPRGLLVLDVPNDFNQFQVAADETLGLDQWWIVPPNHLNYFSPDSLKSLVEKCGYQNHYRESSFPLEMFLLMGDAYVGDPELGSLCHSRRVAFERSLRTTGREEDLHRFYEALAEINLGRQVVLFCHPK